MKLEERYYVGSKHKTNEGYVAEVIEKFPKGLRKIRFNDTHSTEILTHSTNLGRGSVSNPNHRGVCGVGYVGIGEYTNESSISENIRYKIWSNMMNRTYSDKCHINRPTYKNCTVCEEWYNFQNFAKFYDCTYPSNTIDIKFQLDKDLLQQNIENKIYSPETCIWLPLSINSYISKDLNSGVFWYERKNRWMGYVNEFGIGKRIHLGYFKTKEECESVVRKAKMEQDEKAKDYLRSLNYLPEEIIQLIRTV